MVSQRLAGSRVRASVGELLAERVEDGLGDGNPDERLEAGGGRHRERLEARRTWPKRSLGSKPAAV